MGNRIVIAVAAMSLLVAGCSNGASLEQLEAAAGQQEQTGAGNGVRATDPIDFEAAATATAAADQDPAAPMPTATPVPPLPSGYTQSIDPAAISEFDPVDILLADHGFHAALTGYAEPDWVAPNLGDISRPAWPGERLIAVRFDLAHWPRSYNDDESSVLAIKVGDDVVADITPSGGQLTEL